MASLYIKDETAAEEVRKMARRLGTTQTEAVRRGMQALAREHPTEDQTHRVDLVEWMKQRRRDHPLPLATGREADKAFFDRLWGEVD